MCIRDRFTLRHAFTLFTISLVVVSVFAKREYDRRRAEQVSLERRQELEETERNIISGRIHEGMSVNRYLAIAAPCEQLELGLYTEYAHGFPGGLGHGITVTACNNQLVKAHSWSCVGGETFFNTMTDSEESKLDELWDSQN